MPASYKLDVSAPSANPLTTYVDTEKAGTYELDIVLQSYGSVSGTVFDHSTGLSVVSRVFCK